MNSIIMNLSNTKACIFCGGKYEKIVMPKGMEDYEISTVIINKIGTNKIFMGKSLVIRCTTCGNIQTFMEEELRV
jgi:hypothetical protein